MKTATIVLLCLAAVLLQVHADHPSHNAANAAGVNAAPAAPYQPEYEQPARPHPVRRQSSLERARNQVMDFFRSIMSAGSRLRRMASERISTMLSRRSFRNAGRRQDRPQHFRHPQ